MSVEMIALRGFRFAGRDITEGDTIHATPSEERTLRSMGWAKPAPAYTTRDQVAQPPADNESSGRKPRTRRQYRRRDMKAPEA
jgi:hypothetical protein